MTRPKYDVAVYYHTSGFCQWIARHPRFEHVTLAVIGLNALWIWIDTDYNPGSMLLNSPPFFQSVEYFFCIYFSFELAMRFGAFKYKRNGLRDAWFVFDSLLVATMVFESWIMTAVVLLASGGGGGGLGNTSILRMARLLRLTRMARMARLLRAMPELLILIKGMVAATRSVAFTIGLLGVILYIFSIAFVQLCDGSDCEVLFPNVIETMHALLLNAALMDSVSSLVEPLLKQNIALVFMLYSFILIASLTVMNMLIGVICEVVSAVAATERESLNLGFVRDKIEELMTEGEADEDSDGKISKKEFVKLMNQEKALEILQEVGVDGVSLLDLQDTLFASDTNDPTNEEEKKLDFTEFMDLILDLRGGNHATVKDMVTLRKYFDARFARIEERLRPANEGSHVLSASYRKRPSATNMNVPQERTPQTLASSETRSQIEHKTPFLDIFSSMQGMAAEMVSAHELEVAVLREQSTEVVALRERNAILEAKLEKLQQLAHSSPAGCNIEIPDVVDVDRLNNHCPDTGPDEPGEAVESRWWSGRVNVPSFFGSRVQKAHEARSDKYKAVPDPVGTAGKKGPTSLPREEPTVQKV